MKWKFENSALTIVPCALIDTLFLHVQNQFCTNHNRTFLAPASGPRVDLGVSLTPAAGPRSQQPKLLTPAVGSPTKNKKNFNLGGKAARGKMNYQK